MRITKDLKELVVAFAACAAFMLLFNVYVSVVTPASPAKAAEHTSGYSAGDHDEDEEYEYGGGY